MFKSGIPELVLFFDLEWVPDAVAARRLYDLPDDVSEIEAMQTLWAKAGATPENPRPFIKYLYSRVVSIAFLSRKRIYRDGEPTVEFKLNSLPALPIDSDTVDEAHIIERFLYFVGTRCPQLVGYNSQDSDLQVLIQRGLVNEVSAPAFCDRPSKPWEGMDYFDGRNSEGHLDLLKRFSQGAMMPRLDELAKLCGYPGKIDIKGDQVVDLWLDRNITKIIEYNQVDALNTYLVWLRMVHFAGRISEEVYIDEHETFREFLEAETLKPEKTFVNQFLEKWEM